MTSKQDALIEVVDLIKNHGLTLEEVSSALSGAKEFREEKSSGILTKILGYIGGIFVFSGICIFGAMQWDSMDTAGRILMTLGVGFCAFIMAVVSAKDPRYERASTPLFLVAALLQPAGIIVTLKEFSHGGDPAHGLLFMNFVMLLQQGAVFYTLNPTALAFTSIFFGTSMFAIAFDLMGMDGNLEGMTLGLSLICIAWALSNSKHRPIAGIHYLIGSIAFLIALFDVIRNTPVEVFYLGITCGMIFVSTLARSRTLLFVGTAATIGYIGYFSGKYFEHTLGWPLLLILMGFVLIGMSALAVKINKKYINQRG